MEEQPGQHAVAVAAVGSINVGGVNESHRLLFPETATCDESILEARFVKYLNNPTKRFEAIEYAWKKVNELYSLNTIKKQLLEMLGKR